MQDRLKAELDNFSVPGWDGNHAEPLDPDLKATADEFVDILPPPGYEVELSPFTGPDVHKRARLDIIADKHRESNSVSFVFKVPEGWDGGFKYKLQVAVLAKGLFHYWCEVDGRWASGATNDPRYAFHQILEHLRTFVTLHFAGDKE